MNPQAYPLQWPLTSKRWDGIRVGSAFKMTPGAMQGHLFDELDRLGADDIIISSNKKPYSRSEAELLDDPGVAVYFSRHGQQLAFACDKYRKLSDNLHAIGLTIEAIRSIERHGTGEMVDAAFTGFKALPETSAIVTPYSRPWHEVLQVQPDADPEIIKAAWKRLVAKYHPDNQATGDPVKFEEVQKAYNERMEG